MSRTTVGSAQDVVWTDDAPYLTCDRQWEVIGHGRGYILRLVQVPIIFEFLYVRRDRGELYGQLRVLTDLPGTRSYEGALGAPGTFNLTSPQAATNAEFTRVLARRLHRPAVFPAPAFALRIALGRMADEALLSSTRVHPRKLIDAGFRFAHAGIEDALREVSEE